MFLPFDRRQVIAGASAAIVTSANADAAAAQRSARQGAAIPPFEKVAFRQDGIVKSPRCDNPGRCSMTSVGDYFIRVLRADGVHVDAIGAYGSAMNPLPSGIVLSIQKVVPKSMLQRLGELVLPGATHRAFGVVLLTWSALPKDDELRPYFGLKNETGWPIRLRPRPVPAGELKIALAWIGVQEASNNDVRTLVAWTKPEDLHKGLIPKLIAELS